MWKKIACSLAATGLIAAPVMASAQSAGRATQPAEESSELGGSSLIPIALMLAMVGGGVWLVVDDDDDDPVSV
jgi:hypothetical protein